MEMLWIAVTLFAVIMQTLRTAAQKHLTAHLDAVAVTLVRFVFGLPFVVVYLGCVVAWTDEALPPVNSAFIGYSLFASLTQILATVFLVYLFSLRNFAVGTTYARTEAFLTACLGAVFFGEWISLQGWLSIVVSVAGVVVLSVARGGLGQGAGRGGLWNRAAAVGLASGLMFALCSLSIRKASLSLGIDAFLLTAGLTLFAMVVVQTAVLLVYVAVRTPRQLPVMMSQWRVCVFIGLTSALGSIGWFTAMTLERASYVKALGQVEFLFALAISTLFFRERTTRLELVAMVLVGIGVVGLVMAD